MLYKMTIVYYLNIYFTFEEFKIKLTKYKQIYCFNTYY